MPDLDSVEPVSVSRSEERSIATGSRPGEPRQLGLLQGKFVIPDGWDDFTEEDRKDWYGEA
ncbi:MAG: hypothetical protein LBM23_04560 [Propionibacteriaceae bacterium]|nr:hypothetical protein [Propionibacteriaceae bacterium]